MVNDPSNFVDPDGRLGVAVVSMAWCGQYGGVVTVANTVSTVSQGLSVMGGIMNFVSTCAGIVAGIRASTTTAELVDGGFNFEKVGKYDNSDGNTRSTLNDKSDGNSISAQSVNESHSSGPDDWIRNRRTNQLEFKVSVTNKSNTPEGYDYIGDSRAALKASLDGISKQKSFDDGNLISHTSSIFSLAGEYGANRYNVLYPNLFRSRFAEISYRGVGFLDNTGKIWRNATTSTLIRSSIVQKMPPITRFNTTWGRVGAVGSALDIGISFWNASHADGASGIFYYSLEGYLKMPSFIPGFIGLSYGIAFENVMRPSWHLGYGTYSNSIEHGTNPSVIFIMPGLGYCPRVY
jgi:hypothetical protein